MRRKKLLRFILLTVVFSILISTLLYVLKFNPQWFIEKFPHYSWWAAPVAYMIWEFFATLIPPLPNPISAVFAGYLFGTWLALLYTFIGNIAGSTALFMLGRYGKGAFAMRFLKEERRLERVNSFLAREHGFYSLIFVRFSPLFPNDVLSLLLGFTTIPFRRFILTTMLGYSVPFLLLAYIGSLLAEVGGDVSQVSLLPLFALLTILSFAGLVPVAVNMLRHRKRRVVLPRNTRNAW